MLRSWKRAITVGLGAAVAAVSVVAFAGGLPGLTQQAEPRAAQGTGFTYQGRVTVDGVPYAGTCDFRFTLHSDAVTNAQVGAQETVLATALANGLFSVVLNSGGGFSANAFTGDARWLATEARCPAGAGDYVSMGRTALTSTPYASFAMDSAELGGFPAAEYARYARVVLVTAGGTDAANGQNLAMKLASITGASATNRYLLLLEPGVFELAAPLAPGAGIDIAGMQAGTSIITGDGEDGVLQLTSDSTVSNIVIEATGEAGVGVRTGAGTFTLRDVRILSTVTGIQAVTGFAEIILESSSIEILCEVAICTGVDLLSGATLVSRDSDYKLFAGAIADTDQTAINATTGGGDIDLTGGVIRVNAGLSTGTSVGVIGGAGSNVALRGTSLDILTLENVTGIGAGSLRLDDVTMNITSSQGVGIITFGPTIIRESTITTEGPISVWVSEGASTVLIEHSTVTSLATGFALFAQLSGVPDVRHSVITSPADVAVASGASAPNFSFTSLRGGDMIFTGLQPVCAAVTDETNTFFASTCP